MGCNTSKDSVPQNESENKENQEKTTEPEENKSSENQTEGNENKLNENSDTKSVSAKTITLRSNGTAKSVEEPEGDGNTKAPEAAGTKEVNESLGDQDQAAAKIQAAFRGHKTRKSMKQPANKDAQGQQEPTQEELNQEFRPDDLELCNAATKIQASFRGHLTRKQEAEKKNESESSSSQDKKNEGGANNTEELDIDLEDPELNKAAVKIQASFRGHMTRKENETHSN